MNKKLKQRIAWVIMNGLFYVALYFGAFEGNSGATNIVVFFSWYMFIIWLITYLGVTTDKDGKYKEKIPTLERRFPAWVVFIYDAVSVLVMVWSGWILTSIVYILGAIFEYTAMEAVEEKKKEMAKDQETG